MAEMNEFMREIQEDLRQERIEKIWKQYGYHIIAALVGIVLLTTAYVVWKNYEEQQRLKESVRYSEGITFINEGKVQEGLAILKDLSEKGQAYHGIAALNRATALANNDETRGEAIELFQSISNDTRYDDLVRYVAGYYAVLHQMDAVDPDVLLGQLSALMVGSNPWTVMVTELKAALTLKAGRTDEAKQIYTNLLNDNDIPSGVRMRAQASLSQIK